MCRMVFNIETMQGRATQIANNLFWYLVTHLKGLFGLKI